MNVLFLTMSPDSNVAVKGSIYSSLMRKFRDEGHKVYIVSPEERRSGKKTYLDPNNGVVNLHVRTLNVTKTNVIEKGVGQVMLESLFKRAIKKHLADVKFDLILYSTPPITFTNVVKYAKKANPSVISYLMLKDIFPQNAVDMGLLSISGVKGLLYKYFRQKETELYKVSDYIGCMSPANVKYVLKHNPWIDPTVVEIAPNSIEIDEKSDHYDNGKDILVKYGLPTDKPIFIYGGNLGMPQGIPFLIKCLEANKNRKDCHFVVVGSGTYYKGLEDWHKANTEACVTVMKGLVKAEYDKLIKACQVGLIFLDYRFTIPNFPSRLLSYLECKMPVIACTDPNCDAGSIANENGFGIWCPSNNVEAFTLSVDEILKQDIKAMGMKGYEFLKKNYLVKHTYEAIMKHF